MSLDYHYLNVNRQEYFSMDNYLAMLVTHPFYWPLHVWYSNSYCKFYTVGIAKNFLSICVCRFLSSVNTPWRKRLLQVCSSNSLCHKHIMFPVLFVLLCWLLYFCMSKMLLIFDDQFHHIIHFYHALHALPLFSCEQW